MVLLIPVQYNKRKYPQGITPRILEIPGHFDALPIADRMPYSLHTEYSYSARCFSSPSLDRLQTIKASERNGIPQLWHNESWVKQFCTFISRFTSECPPKVIEIHPPFVDYCPTIAEFIELYGIFEEFVRHKYPSTQVLIENRCGSRNRYPFLISSSEDLIKLVEQIKQHSLSLQIAFDPIGMLTACEQNKKLTNNEIKNQLHSLKECSTHISGLHLWGKKLNETGRRVSHVGDLSSYFNSNELKRTFLDSLCDLLDDGFERFFVPEVNSNDKDLCSIIEDLIPRFKFV